MSAHNNRFPQSQIVTLGSDTLAPFKSPPAPASTAPQWRCRSSARSPSNRHLHLPNPLCITANPPPQVNDKFAAAANYSINAKKENVAKVGFISTVSSDSSYRAIVSSEGSVALNYKQKLTASSTLCLGTKLSLASLSTPAAVTAGLSISL